MPILQIYTTLAKSKIPANFAFKTGQLLMQIMNKPLQSIVVNVNGDQNIFSGKDPEGKEERAFATLDNIYIAKDNIDQKRSAADLLSKHISQQLGINNNRIIILFHDLDAYSVGIGGKLRADIKDHS